MEIAIAHGVAYIYYVDIETIKVDYIRMTSMYHLDIIFGFCFSFCFLCFCFLFFVFLFAVCVCLGDVFDYDHELVKTVFNFAIRFG